MIMDSKLYQSQIKNLARQIPNKDCTILVTGASGMIGSTLIDVLLHSNQECNNDIKVIALGRNLEKMKSRFSYSKSNISFVIQDVTSSLMLCEHVDYIVHAASNADPNSYSVYPVETLLTNIIGTYNMLEYCKVNPNTRLLITSSFEAYGKIDGRETYSENDSGEIDLNQIRSCYPESKRTSEILMRCYGKEYNVDYVIARLCSVYGPTMGAKDSKAHAQFIRNGLSGENIVLKSEGLQKRTYSYIIDVVSGILKVLFNGLSGEAYNIAYENSIHTIAEVAKTVADICSTEVVYDLPNEIEKNGFSRPQNCVLDNTKLKLLGWAGTFTLREGLKSTIDILKECANAGNS